MLQPNGSPYRKRVWQQTKSMLKPTSRALPGEGGAAYRTCVHEQSIDKKVIKAGEIAARGETSPLPTIKKKRVKTSLSVP